jgi:hypothetical protein
MDQSRFISYNNHCYKSFPRFILDCVPVDYRDLTKCHDLIDFGTAVILVGVVYYNENLRGPEADIITSTIFAIWHNNWYISGYNPRCRNRKCN